MQADPVLKAVGQKCGVAVLMAIGRYASRMDKDTAKLAVALYAVQASIFAFQSLFDDIVDSEAEWDGERLERLWKTAIRPILLEGEA